MKTTLLLIPALLGLVASSQAAASTHVPSPPVPLRYELAVNNMLTSNLSFKYTDYTGIVAGWKRGGAPGNDELDFVSTQYQYDVSLQLMSDDNPTENYCNITITMGDPCKVVVNAQSGNMNCQMTGKTLSVSQG